MHMVAPTNSDGHRNTENPHPTIAREDFWATTSNKQLNFVQHVRSQLKIDSRAAVVVPDTGFEGC